MTQVISTIGPRVGVGKATTSVGLEDINAKMDEAVGAFQTVASGADEEVNAGVRQAQIAAMLAAAFPIAALLGIIGWLKLG